jgi:uncharacterized membrane protein YedE/YeeE
MTSISSIVLSGGFLIGLVFGVVGLMSGFCVVSGLRNLWTKGDGRMIRAVSLAAAVAILGTQLLSALGYVDLSKSIYLVTSFSAPVVLLGGLLFGYGMVAANACASRALVLLGRGNLRSLAVIATIGITAEMTLKGLMAPVRLALVTWSQTTVGTNSLPAFLTNTGLSPATAVAAALVVSACLALHAFSYAPFRASKLLIAAGLIIGSLVPAGWLITGFLGADPFEPVPVASLTFIAPIADSLQYVMLSTGSTLNFGIVVIAGVLVGSFLTSLLTRSFHIEGYSSTDHMLRSVGGAAMMGIGGVMAFGCSIGQGLTGLSTLALPSAIAVSGILLGAAAALRSPVRIVALAST